MLQYSIFRKQYHYITTLLQIENLQKSWPTSTEHTAPKEEEEVLKNCAEQNVLKMSLIENNLATLPIRMDYRNSYLFLMAVQKNQAHQKYLKNSTTENFQ